MSDKALEITISISDREDMKAQMIEALSILGATVGTRDGCWIAYHSDRSAVAVFGDELTALRHASDNSMTVRFVQWGDEL